MILTYRNNNALPLSYCAVANVKLTGPFLEYLINNIVLSNDICWPFWCPNVMLVVRRNEPTILIIILPYRRLFQFFHWTNNSIANLILMVCRPRSSRASAALLGVSNSCVFLPSLHPLFFSYFSGCLSWLPVGPTNF